MLFWKICFGCLVLSLGAPVVHAANGVVVESKTVAPGATDVTVGIYLENDVSVVAVVIPLEFRSIDGDAYLARKLSIDLQGRLMKWKKGEKFLVISQLSNPYPRGGKRACTRGFEPGAWQKPDSTIDFRSPDAMLFSCVGVEPATIKPGADGEPGQGTPSLVLSFDVAAATGQFIIDTTCISPANHLVFVNDRRPFDQKEISEVSFKAGVITVAKP